MSMFESYDDKFKDYKKYAEKGDNMSKNKVPTEKEHLEDCKKVLESLGWRMAKKGGLTVSDWKELVIDKLDKRYG